uniref:hypothetical protein n=1 Tax=Mongoliitalea daihaiensis TaxID=2782006 RepID=UPI001F455579|nr:hypothetical protein [Mongoliitalea daihaiensis]
MNFRHVLDPTLDFLDPEIGSRRCGIWFKRFWLSSWFVPSIKDGLHSSMFAAGTFVDIPAVFFKHSDLEWDDDFGFGWLHIK